jgi:uncharacterized protein DUF1559
MAGRFRPVDLVFVVAGIALVAALVIPAILAAREAGRRTACEDNLQRLALGALNYSDVYLRFPPGTTGSRKLPPAERFSWYPSIWNFIEGKPPRLLLDETQAWNSEANSWPKVEYMYDEWGAPTERTQIRPLHSMRLFACPSAGQTESVLGISVTHYVGMAGQGLKSPEFDLDQPGCGVWGYDRQVQPSDVVDGLSSTISLVETNLNPGPWLAGGPPTVRGIDTAAAGYFGKGRQFGGLHHDCTTVMLDGSVRHLASETDPAVFSAMVTIKGGD